MDTYLPEQAHVRKPRRVRRLYSAPAPAPEPLPQDRIAFAFAVGTVFGAVIVFASLLLVHAIEG